MSNRMLRAGLWTVVFAGSSLGAFAACSSDDSADLPGGGDASYEASFVDVRSNTDSTLPGNDSGGKDSGTDAPKDTGLPDVKDSGTDVDSAPPPLCNTYTSSDIPGRTDAGEEATINRYEAIAARAMFTGVRSVAGSCELGLDTESGETPFIDFNDPDQVTCLKSQLAALAGCAPGTFIPSSYEGATDTSSNPCINDAGKSVQIGVYNRPGGYTSNEIDYFIDLVREAAISTGMTAVDADRLKQSLLAKKNLIQIADAGGGDAGFPKSTCP